MKMHSDDMVYANTSKNKTFDLEAYLYKPLSWGISSSFRSLSFFPCFFESPFFLALQVSFFFALQVFFFLRSLSPLFFFPVPFFLLYSPFYQ